MGIPTCLAGGKVPFHCLIAGDNILEYPGEDVVDTWATIGGGGSIIESKVRSIPMPLEALFKDASFPPEAQNMLLYLGEIYLATCWFEHS